MSAVFLTGAIAGLCFGIVLTVCGLYFNNWRYWFLLTAFCITLHVGRALG